MADWMEIIRIHLRKSAEMKRIKSFLSTKRRRLTRTFIQLGYKDIQK
jgi:hypothetical protein